MTRCFEPREIAAALALPAADPGRRHLDDCPRCRNLAVAYAEFMDQPPAGEWDLAGADAELQRRLARAVADRPRRPWWRLDLPRPVWASAAAVLAVGAFLLLGNDLVRPDRRDLTPGAGVLRGTEPGRGLLVTADQGALEVTWPATAVDDQAVVVFFDAKMNELGRVATAGTHLVVAADDPLAAAVYCQLWHLNAGDTVARSAIVATRPARE